MADEHGREEHTVSSVRFQFMPIPPEDSLKIMTRVLKVVGAPMGSAIGAFKGDEGEQHLDIMDKKIDLAIIGDAVTALCTGLNEVEILTTIKLLLRYVRIEVPETGGFVNVNLNVHFQKKLGLLFGVVRKAMEVNFSDFLSVVTKQVLDSVKIGGKDISPAGI